METMSHQIKTPGLTFKRATSWQDHLDIMEGLGLDRGHGGGVSGDKFVAHKEWTKEPFPDDFDDEDLE